MRDALPAGHLVNWFGHAAGALVFGLFLGLLAGDRSPGRNKAVAATWIALLWNVAELAGLVLGAAPAWLLAFESTAFSLLPALLYDLVIGGSPRWAVRAGYALSAGAALFHLAELVSDSEVLHGAGLYMVATGFCALAVYAAIGRRKRALPALALLLLSLSILHFAEDEQHTAWWVELLVHHAGIPLSMFVLLQDYRFVFLDALIRFLANIFAALVFAAAGQVWWEKWPSTALAGFTILLVLYAFTRTRLEALLTRLVFRRTDLTGLLDSLRPAPDEASFLSHAEARIRQYFASGEPSWEAEDAIEGPFVLGDGAEAALGVRGAEGQIRLIRLGRRHGGRRYLSGDLEALRKVGGKLNESLEFMREEELRRLVSQAELRALQAQIHPHFLFNALNTLYGIIPKEAAGARRTVLNLSDIFRYFLQTEQTFVPLQDELHIVKAYLEIEQLRLGNRLKVAFSAPNDALLAPIPLLSVQPLVENAVKHGVAAKAEGGAVTVTARREGDSLWLEVHDTGGGFAASRHQSGAGVGLENVRQRLRLCYGAAAALEVESSSAGTTVRFPVPFPL